ncbi:MULTISPECIES: hemopexin repeat-containing protein [Enterobacter cloacae complex]|nr:hemopexin repeat-containing protein [Enterobacter asburiae]MCU6239927.1 photopexin B [Enterobacter asburiae]
MNLKGYLFLKSENTRFDAKKNKADVSYPQSIAKDWQGLPTEFQSDLDDVINLDDMLVFFKGNNYLKFDVKKEKVIEGPKNILQGWPGLQGTGFETGIDAATEWAVWGSEASEPNAESVLLFKGDQCVIYNLKSHTAEKKLVTDKFPELKNSNYSHFAGNLDTVLLWNNKKAYFFKGNDYIRYDLEKEHFDQSSNSIQTYWYGVSQLQIQASVLFDISLLGTQPVATETKGTTDPVPVPALPANTQLTVTLINNEEWVRTAILNIDGKDTSMEVAGNKAISKAFTTKTGKVTFALIDSQKGAMMLPSDISTTTIGATGKTMGFGAEKPNDEKRPGFMDVYVHIDWDTVIIN